MAIAVLVVVLEFNTVVVVVVVKLLVVVVVAASKILLVFIILLMLVVIPGFVMNITEVGVGILVKVMIPELTVDVANTLDMSVVVAVRLVLIETMGLMLEMVKAVSVKSKTLVLYSGP